jgi:histidinol-phosphatase (PHP family)
VNRRPANCATAQNYRIVVSLQHIINSTGTNTTTMVNHSRPPWKVSLHGGHSGEYCDHAQGTLREVLEAAVQQGYHTYGVSEHAPRLREDLLYDNERAMGWDLAKITADFERYAQDIFGLAEEFSDRLIVLCGFEIEVVPEDRWLEIMRGYRNKYPFEYIVGSVHYLHEMNVDGTKDMFEKLLIKEGGLEPMAIHYYETVSEMVRAIKPEVVAHLDLVRRNAPSNESVETPAIKAAAMKTLEVIREHGGILDLNTAGYRKGLIHPYPAPWLLQEAHKMDIGLCFGEDSHGPQDVGAGIEDARKYLIEHGIETVTVLTKEHGRVVKKVVSLR